MSYANFIAHCVEVYRREQKLSGKQVMELFDKKNVLDFIVRNYEPLHIQGAKGIVWELNDYMGIKV